ncbi:MAG: hypothetical protein JOY51_01770 [Nevskia sp.]|nr:hypothetical protein [Nevskia sp.]
MGVASLARGPIDRQAFVDLADMALYRAKNGGRNRVVRALVKDAAAGQYEMIEPVRLEEQPPMRLVMVSTTTALEPEPEVAGERDEAG